VYSLQTIDLLCTAAVFITLVSKLVQVLFHHLILEDDCRACTILATIKGVGKYCLAKYILFYHNDCLCLVLCILVHAK